LSRATEGESLVFAIASAAVALHVLVDAFVLLEPGVSRVDHLVPGLVPVATLSLAAWLFPRVRAGLAASGALVLGALALVGFAVVVNGARADGVGGSDWTGLLLAPAGAVLVGLGVRLLWRTRRKSGGRARRILRRALIAVGALLVLYWVVLPAGLALMATHRPRSVDAVPDLGAPAVQVTVRTEDGLDLWGQYVASRNGAAVVLYPGEWAADHARMLVGNGYGVLLLDPRGYGRSEGDPNAYGWGNVRDLEAAVQWLRGRRDVEDGRIGGLGLSVGGEQMIEAAAGNDFLRAVVSEGAGTRSVREALVREGPSALELALQFPMDLVQTLATAVFSGDAPPPSLETLAAQIAPNAVFFIYGEEGQAIEEAVNVPYHAAAGEPKELWEVPGAAHTGGIDAQPDDYERRVLAFFEEALPSVR
jgi:dienelactone hydrolase